ncbi:nucleolus protein [Coprinopsis marcescibilis]|uniref:25S rRNA adenine-N(1) methyltransferase n=1 Tax=Coprinopsis marcescibilis TaxID=230819 RepID=A0A5C3KWK6_COPMA|nr:nucleolus protein [Coprinopsis marcescibilis]
MPKSRKRKVPIAQIDHGTTTASRPQATRTVIREFHVLLKRQAYLQKQATQDVQVTSELSLIQQRIDELGGLQRYQHMSAVGQKDDRGGGSHRLFISWLKEAGVHKVHANGNKLSLLEVGALEPDNYKTCSSWIEVSPIDLNSRHPAIKQQDFLEIDPEENREKWSAISLSLVLNFVPDATARGRMLRLAHQLLVPEGYLFVALPLPCISNSRYMTFERFQELMTCVGFVQIQEKWREGGKMIYYLYRKGPPDITNVPGLSKFGRKEVLRRGNRNNFAILLDV